MPRTAYPTDAQIVDFIEGTGITLPDAFVITGYGAMASSEFERLTGYTPFLMDTADVTRRYDPPGGSPASHSVATQHGGGRYLPLHAGLLTLTSLTVNGVAKTVDTDFRLLPLNASAMKRPYEAVQFKVPIWGQMAGVAITGKWGFWTEIPEDAWQAILRLGAALAIQDLAQGIGADVYDWTEGNSSEKYSVELVQKLGVSWREFTDRVVGRYQLITVGI